MRFVTVLCLLRDVLNLTMLLVVDYECVPVICLFCWFWCYMCINLFGLFICYLLWDCSLACFVGVGIAALFVFAIGCLWVDVFCLVMPVGLGLLCCFADVYAGLLCGVV